MKLTRTFLVASLFLVPLALEARAQSGGILLSAVAGTVEVQEGPDQPWKPAAAGAEVREGFSIRTGPDGRAQISFPDKAMVWIKENSTFGMQSTLPLTRKVQLLVGSVKADIPHLKRKQTFEVHTANAVAAVRGTRFTATALPGGGIDIKVAFGEVKVSLLGQNRSFTIPQGHSFGQEEGEEGEVKLMNKDQENEVLEDWSPATPADQRTAALEQKEEDRADIQSFARQTDQQQAVIDNLVSQTKDEDFAAGRTLVDVHGNLVRVDQKLLRPDSQTVQFLNLVKRPSYDYKDGLGASKPWRYNGTTVANRLDTMQAKIVFDQKLPQDLVEWPAFFSDNDVKTKTADFFFTNQTNPSDILLMGTFSVYCGKTAQPECLDTSATPKPQIRDEIAGNFYVGSNLTLADLGDRTALLGKLLTTERVSDRNPSVGSYENTGEESGTLFSHDAVAYCAPNCTTSGHQHFWLASESYVIDNTGNIRTVDSLVKSDKDPFSLLKETAGQLIFHFKDPTGGSGSDPASSAQLSNSDSNFSIGGKTLNASNRNIDLVIVPDLVVSMVQRLATALGEIDSGDSGSGSN